MQQSTRRQAGWLTLIILVALVIRLAYLLEIRQTPFFLAPVIDADFYHRLAQSLAAGEGTGRAPFMMPPLYPLSLSALYALVGVDLFGAHLLQFFFGILSSVLTFLIGWRLAGPAVGIVAGLLVATNRALLYVEGDLLATPLAVLLDLAFLYTLLRYRQSGRLWVVAVAGVVLGLAALARPTALVLLPVFLVWLLWNRQRLAAVVLALMTVLPILPVSVHNHRASGEWVWISANGGINFWIGNNPDMRQTVALRPGPEWRRMNDLPLREAGLVTPVERDRWFWRHGLEAILTDPLGASRRMLEKSVLLVHNHEIMRDFDFYYFRQEFSRVLWIPSGNFAFLFSLALVTLILVRPRRAHEGLLWWFLLAYSASIVAFFVTARYRAPLLPLLSLAAAMSLVWVWQQVQARRWRSLGSTVVVIALACLLSLPDYYGVDSMDVVESQYRIAKARENGGDLPGAFAGYEAVLQQDPRHALAAARAAGCQQRLGQVQDAVDRYERILQMHPEYVEVMVNLANVAWRVGDRATAHGYFELAQTTDPWYAQAFGYHAMYRASLAEHVAALPLYDRALELDPAWDQLRLEKARSQVSLGSAAAALATLQSLPEKQRQGNAVYRELLGDALSQLGRHEEARQEWLRALEITPTNPTLRAKLQGRRP